MPIEALVEAVDRSQNRDCGQLDPEKVNVVHHPMLSQKTMADVEKPGALMLRLAEMMQAPDPEEGEFNLPLQSLLRSLSPADLVEHVLPEHYCAVVQMIVNYVPGYGPH